MLFSTAGRVPKELSIEILYPMLRHSSIVTQNVQQHVVQLLVDPWLEVNRVHKNRLPFISHVSILLTRTIRKLPHHLGEVFNKMPMIDVPTTIDVGSMPNISGLVWQWNSIARVCRPEVTPAMFPLAEVV